MFLTRGLAVSFSVFFLLYSVLSVAVALGWTVVAFFTRDRSQRVLADSLFLARVFPLVVAALATLLFVAPSFVLLEPRLEQERLGLLPLMLGWAGSVLIVFGLWNAVVALKRTARVVLSWRSSSHAVESKAPVPVFCTSLASGGCKEPPPFAVAGIVRPAVFMSAAAAATLTGPELESVIRHEVAHVRRRDNLKRLVFRMCAFPFMRSMEHAWAEATEAAADDAAVSNVDEALDLAAALVKLSRLVSGLGNVGSVEVRPNSQLTMALLHGGTSVPTRVERLVAWRCPPPATARAQRAAWTSAAVGVGVVALSYGPLLAGAHAITELLMQ